MKICVTTDNGELIELFTDDEIGDTGKTLAMLHLMDSLKRAITNARRQEKIEQDCKKRLN